jgi:septum formation protein
MLENAGVDVRVIVPDVDDARLRRGSVSPIAWVMALAYLKARRAYAMLGTTLSPQGTVLGADTVCVSSDGEILGQPRDVDDARRMLKTLRNAEHQTITGVCLLPRNRNERIMFCDAATVRVGELSDQQIEEYMASNDWRGKAGAYNFSERVEAGWPIECTGDPATVMGLPMRRLLRYLDQEA